MTCWVRSSNSSLHRSKFVDLVPCESEDKIFLICHVITQLKCHVTLWVDSLMLSHHPAKFGVHTLYESGKITLFICHVTTCSIFHVTLWVGSPHPKLSPC